VRPSKQISQCMRRTDRQSVGQQERSKWPRHFPVGSTSKQFHLPRSSAIFTAFMLAYTLVICASLACGLVGRLLWFLVLAVLGLVRQVHNCECEMGLYISKPGPLKEEQWTCRPRGPMLATDDVGSTQRCREWLCATHGAYAEHGPRVRIAFKPYTVACQFGLAVHV
jgi:hypothetical protein